MAKKGRLKRIQRGHKRTEASSESTEKNTKVAIKVTRNEEIIAKKRGQEPQREWSRTQKKP